PASRDDRRRRPRFPFVHGTSLQQSPPLSFVLFFFNDPPTSKIYTLSLHDALPISFTRRAHAAGWPGAFIAFAGSLFVFRHPVREDRKSTRLNSSHVAISYAVLCLKKKIQAS